MEELVLLRIIWLIFKWEINPKDYMYVLKAKAGKSMFLLYL